MGGGGGGVEGGANIMVLKACSGESFFVVVLGCCIFKMGQSSIFLTFHIKHLVGKNLGFVGVGGGGGV